MQSLLRAPKLPLRNADEQQVSVLCASQRCNEGRARAQREVSRTVRVVGKRAADRFDCARAPWLAQSGGGGGREQYRTQATAAAAAASLKKLTCATGKQPLNCAAQLAGAGRSTSTTAARKRRRRVRRLRAHEQRQQQQQKRERERESQKCHTPVAPAASLKLVASFASAVRVPCNR